MGSRHAVFHFPLSPPSSATPSPHLSPIISHDVDKLFSTPTLPSFRQSQSLTSVRPGKQRAHSNASDSDGYNTEKISSRKSPRKAMNRALTLPSSSTPMPHYSGSPQKGSRPLVRTSSISSSSSSTSTPTDGENTLSPHPSAGIGRKVAATLQLFKETAGPSEEPSSGEPSSSRDALLGSRRGEPFHDVEDVAEAFEFVKRSEWPDRESAAVRREKSMSKLERVKTRESISGEHQGSERKPFLREPPLSDVVQWRRDLAVGRGRRRERAVDEPACDTSDVPLSSINTFHEVSPIYIRPRSRAYPPSPSPSRSPTTRQLLSRHLAETPILPCTEPTIPTLPSIRTTPRQSRSPTPVRAGHHLDASYSAPISPLESISPWSTDDESTWETASATSTATSQKSLFDFSDTESQSFPSALPHQPPSLVSNYHNTRRFSLSDDGEVLNNAPLRTLDNETFALDINVPEERLPHIPLRPFRNQVGGHSAIYKFTKQAVCKVQSIIMFPITFADFIFSLWSREKTCSTSP